jgi:acyl-CoA reductase-like NAD-dependent aldehyde dehydrogenase
LVLGLTKSIDFRKQQLQRLVDLCLENTEALSEALYKDLRKHKVESVVGEISPVVDECRFMIKVCTGMRF